MDLPAGPLTTEGQQAIQIFRSLLRAPVRPDMAGLQTVANGQQIHTGQRTEACTTVEKGQGIEKGGKPLHYSRLTDQKRRASTDFPQNCSRAHATAAPRLPLVRQDFLLETQAVPLRARLPQTASSRRSRPQAQR